MSRFAMFAIIALLGVLFISVVTVNAQDFKFTPSSSHSVTTSRTATISHTPAPSISATPTPTRTPTPTLTPTSSNSHSATPTRTPSRTPSASVTPTPTLSVSETPSISITPSVSPCPVCPSASPCPGATIGILEAKVAQVYTNLIYPTSTEILAGLVTVTNLFAPNVIGRIDPVGTFNSFQLLTEYFYALAANPSNFISSVDFTDLFGVGNEVYVRVNVFFQAVDPNTTISFNLTQSGRFLFNDDDLIESCDLVIHYLGKRSNPVFNRPVYTAQQTENIEEICYTLLVSPATCANPALDPEGYYTSLEDCIDFMTNNITYGTWDDAQANSFVCRQLHTLLTFFDPVTHCPHAGKTGGGKCVDWDYPEYYAESYRKKK